MTILYVLLGLLLLGVGILAFRRLGQKPDDTFHHFRCSGCKRRIRYQLKQVGRKGACSHCAAELIFPPLDQALD